MGELNEELRVLQDNLDGSKSSDERDFAKYGNVFMVRGIFSNLYYPFGYHASKSFNADQLFLLVWDASGFLECIGFKVQVWVCDGATPKKCLQSILCQTGIMNIIGQKIYSILPAKYIYCQIYLIFPRQQETTLRIHMVIETLGTCM